MILTGKTEVLGKNPVAAPFSPPKISYKLTRDRTLTEVSGIKAINNFTAYAFHEDEHRKIPLSRVIYP